MPCARCGAVRVLDQIQVRGGRRRESRTYRQGGEGVLSAFRLHHTNSKTEGKTNQHEKRVVCYIQRVSCRWRGGDGFQRERRGRDTSTTSHPMWRSLLLLQHLTTAKHPLSHQTGGVASLPLQGRYMREHGSTYHDSSTCRQHGSIASAAGLYWR